MCFLVFQICRQLSAKEFPERMKAQLQFHHFMKWKRESERERARARGRGEGETGGEDEGESGGDAGESDLVLTLAFYSSTKNKTLIVEVSTRPITAFFW